MSKTIELTDDNFEDEISNTEVPILVDYWAEWCGPVSYTHLTLPTTPYV